MAPGATGSLKMPCAYCGRSFHSTKSRKQYELRMAVRRELEGGEIAMHLGPIITYSYSGEPGKQDRKRENSRAHRRGQV